MKKIIAMAMLVAASGANAGFAEMWEDTKAFGAKVGHEIGETASSAADYVTGDLVDDVTEKGKGFVTYVKDSFKDQNEVAAPVENKAVEAADNATEKAATVK